MPFILRIHIVSPTLSISSKFNLIQTPKVIKGKLSKQ